MQTLIDTLGDGNCMFRAFSYVLTGSQGQFAETRSAIVGHMLHNDSLCMSSTYMGLGDTYRNVSHYINSTQMNRNATWGTTVEILALAHLLRVAIYVYSVTSNTWQQHCPSHLNPSLHVYESNSDCGIYLFHTGDHYLIVRGITH